MDREPDAPSATPPRDIPGLEGVPFAIGRSMYGDAIGSFGARQDSETSVN
jgi:hypothetical protein